MTTLASAAGTKLVEELIPIIENKAIINRYASKLKMSKGPNGTVQFDRLLPLSLVSPGNGAETDVTQSPQDIYSNKITTTPSYTRDSLRLTKQAKILTIVDDKDMKDLLANQIAKIQDRWALKEISRYGFHHRVDNDATYEVSGTADSGSVTTLVDDALTQNDDHWGTDTSNPGYMAFMPPGTNMDIATLCTNFATSGDVATLATLPQAVDSTSLYHAVRGTGIVATDVLTVASLSRVVAGHELFQTPRFANGAFAGFIDSGQKQDLFNDTELKTIRDYIAPGNIEKYEVQRLLGVEFIVHNQIYREDEDGSENYTSGIVHNATIIGENAFNITRWGDGSDAFNLRFYFVGGPDDPDYANFWGNIQLINWDMFCAIKVLRCTSAISLMTGATALIGVVG